jgi:hypothetical protein
MIKTQLVQLFSLSKKIKKLKEKKKKTACGGEREREP